MKNPKLISASVLPKRHAPRDAHHPRPREDERGYTLVALLALMTIMAIALTAVAPSIKQQVQREREKEAIARGEEVADAIRLYVRAKNGALPTSIDQLLEGIPFGTKKIQILRPSAARDPLSNSGEWKLIKPTDPAMSQFKQAIILYAGGRPIQTRDQALARYDVFQITGITSLGSGEKAPGGEDDSGSSSNVSFIGVASRSQRDSVLTYYDIERHDEWIFTPLFK